MFDGRHCTREDLNLLVKETNKIKLLIEKNPLKIEKNEDLRCFLAFLSRFDASIAIKLEMQVDTANGDCERIINAINACVDELKQNIIVDIYEHQ